MDKIKSEEVKFKILERRNYLKSVDAPLSYSKRNLYGGMQARVGRIADRSFHEDIVKQKKLIENKLLTINKHLDKLSAYDKNLIAYNNELAAYNETISTPIVGDIGVMSFPIAPVSPIRPSCSVIAVGIRPQRSEVRSSKMGISSRGGKY